MSITTKVKNETKNFISNYITPNKNGYAIDIEKITKDLGINLVQYMFDEDISGVLVTKDKISTIGVNQAHSEVRRRFTIAHELGHYILHRNEGNMFMDKILFRKSTDYKEKDLKLEIEANYFAANVLMPEEDIFEYITENNIDFHEDDEVRQLAKVFKVSSWAMTYRLINLGLVYS
ncbi:ImmA/IrrE family metallo-endopeptidase [Polluticaenibacter yanchengensis]|uniref:ImmA/IrrE family metallo-endopeptidase n=1 Tax=Polluticaenibacter yanchengensis TaxID=3014562 RepID=A0ABT4UPB6_9BACT|nr:ImmA/IrrE family metallo-endopeptidase [Chitinophagaceae bacterium LY-5]